MSNLYYAATYNSDFGMLVFCVHGQLTYSDSIETTFSKTDKGYVYKIKDNGTAMSVMRPFHDYRVVKADSIPRVYVCENDDTIEIPVKLINSELDHYEMSITAKEFNPEHSGEWPLPIKLPGKPKRDDLVNIVEKDMETIRPKINDLVVEFNNKRNTDSSHDSILDGIFLESKKNEIPDNQELVIEKAAIKAMSVCIKKVIAKTDMPKQIKIDGWTLYCRNAWIEVAIHACHPSMNTIRDEVNRAIAFGVAAAGIGGIVSGGTAAWTTFKAVFYTKMMKAIGDIANTISINLSIKHEHGNWGRC